MARRPLQGKLYHFFTIPGDDDRAENAFRSVLKRVFMVAGIAIAMFIALFAWGARYFGWSDPSGKIQLAMVTSFILGIVASYKSRG